MKYPPPQPDLHSGEVIATFGDARLIKKFDQKYELTGGSEADRAEAQKWISMFMKNSTIEGVASNSQNS